MNNEIEQVILCLSAINEKFLFNQTKVALIIYKEQIVIAYNKEFEDINYTLECCLCMTPEEILMNNKKNFNIYFNEIDKIVYKKSKKNNIEGYKIVIKANGFKHSFRIIRLERCA